MAIKKVKIKNFKCFAGWFEIDFDRELNILVGNNGTGKSTILEAINLGLTGLYHGKNIRNELSQYLFNKDILDEYLNNIKDGEKVTPPEIIIEIYFYDKISEFEGDGNSENNKDVAGIVLSIEFDERYANEYQLMLNGELNSLPIEYYEMNWYSFSRELITARSIPVKSALIDSTNCTPISGSDIYISRIIKNILEDKDIVEISQAHRRMKELFLGNKSVVNINNKLSQTSDREISISVDFGTKNSWETSLITQLDDVPYNNIGKGGQCILKTQLALSDERMEKKHIILIEEPECHLSYSNLNIMLNSLVQAKENKQLIISTHSSFVSNKLGLENLILISQGKTLRLREVSGNTSIFFKKLSGYDTLRLLLSSKAILVEGDSDELVIQRAYMDANEGKLPIHDGIDVISVGTSFLRFLEIAERLDLRVSVVTDNDGNISGIENKYNKYLGENEKENIKICFDTIEYSYSGKLENYNFNTLEPCIERVNGLTVMNNILGKSFEIEDQLLDYMRKNKTEVALRIFESKQAINYPQYIVEAIKL